MNVRRACRHLVLLDLASLSVVMPLVAQTAQSSDVTIVTDRPSVTNSSVVVPQGGFQAENGFAVTYTAGDYSLDLPETNLRYGLLRKTELRFAVPNYFQNLS